MIDAYIEEKNPWTLPIKELEKEVQTEPKVSWRKETTNIRAEIDEIQTKETIEKINESKSSFLKR